MSTNHRLANVARLSSFVGSWTTDGKFRPESEAAGAFTASDNYEWLDGGFFLIHRWQANMPTGINSGIEVIGYDPTTGTFPMHSFDNEGNASNMSARSEGETWFFEGPTLRFEGRFEEGGDVLSGTWEQRTDSGEWRPWLDVKLRRVAKQPKRSDA
jgi:hypothetical protein